MKTEAWNGGRTAFRAIAIVSWIGSVGVSYLTPDFFGPLLLLSIVVGLTSFAMPNLFFGLFPLA